MSLKHLTRFAAAASLLVSLQAGAGYLVVNNDEWTLTDFGFAQSPSAATFATNVAGLFTGDSTGSFLAYSNNFGFTGTSLGNTLQGAGHTLTVTTAPTFDLALLQQYDGVFLGGLAVDQQVVIDYLQGGGNVYIAGGTGSLGGAAAEAAAWNAILATAGLQFASTFNGITGNIQPVGPHPLLQGVGTLYFDNGNTVIDTAPGNPNGEILYAFNGAGMLALGVFGDLPPPSQFAPIPAPEPGVLVLVAIGLLVTAACARRHAGRRPARVFVRR